MELSYKYKPDKKMIQTTALGEFNHAWSIIQEAEGRNRIKRILGGVNTRKGEGLPLHRD